MTAPTGTVFVVDDDEALRTSLRNLFGAAGLAVETFGSAAEFLAGYDGRRCGCVVLDLRLRGESGLDLLDELTRRGPSAPVVMLTAHGSVPASVRAIKAGAVDFLEKPAPPALLLARVCEALETARRQRDTEVDRAALRSRFARLTPREEQVARLLVAGKSSKQIGTELGVSFRTVEGYRSRVLEKMQVASSTELVGTLLRAGVVPPA